MRALRLCSLVFLCLAAGQTLSAQDWTRFRGPNGSGESEASFPGQWTEKDIQWKSKLPGMGHSSPVLWGDKIFLLSAEPDTVGADAGKRYVLCLNAGDGQVIWKRDFPGAKYALHVLSSYASCTPAVDEKRVYFAWSDRQHTVLMALDHSGNNQWVADFGPWVSQHGFGTSPMLIDDMVVLSCSQEPAKRPNEPDPYESFVVAVDKETGNLRWRTPRKTDTASFSVPCIRKTADGKKELICCSTIEGIFGLDPKTGKENWSEQVFKLRTVSSPLLVGGLIIGTTGQGGGAGNALVAIKPGAKPEVAYEIRKGAPYVPTPVAKGNLVFLWSDAGILTCIKADKGETVWTSRIGGNNEKFYGSPVRAGDKIFCVADTGVVYCVAATDKFEKLGNYDLKEDSRSTPAIAGGKMYVRTFSHLYCIGGKKS